MIRLRVWANVHPMGWFGHAAGDFFFEYLMLRSRP